ncbi:peptidyl-prolyl cis-trans isomerase [Candidatus Sumerlaeota bacterium]|nr:peptidyl-prolyl cis-trans isomerase [Candidatus Sumerlaeota bacterium]
MKIYRLFFAAILIAFCYFPGAQEVKTTCPALQPDYSTPNGTILARSSLGVITDTDILLLLAIAKDKDPNIFARYQNTINPKDKKDLQIRLQDAVKSYVFIRQLAEENPSEIQEDFDRLQLRLQTYPLYELVWVEEILKSILNIHPEDLIAYYERNKDQYERPASVKIRIMYLHAPRILPELERQKILQKIETLRERVLAGENFDYLVKTYSSFYPGTTDDGVMEVFHSDTYNRFYEEARAIKVNAFSPVFQREDGLFFIQCLEKKDPEVIPLSTVRKDITRILKAKAIRFLYALEWNKLSERYHPSYHWSQWEEMKDTHVLVRVGKLKIAKSDFWRLFPEIISDALELNERLILEKVQMIHQYECIRLEVERKKRSEHPFIIQGTRIAQDQLIANRCLDALFTPLKMASEEEVKKYYEDHPEISTINSSKRVRQIVGEVINPTHYDSKALQDVFLKMEANLHFFIREASDLIKAEKEKITGEDNSAYPQLSSAIFEDLLKKYSTDLYRFEFRDLGLVKPEDAGDIWSLFENLFPGDFSPIEKAVPFVYCHYVEEFDPGERKPFSEVQEQVRKRLVQSRMGKAARDLKDQIIGKTGLQFEQVLQ